MARPLRQLGIAEISHHISQSKPPPHGAGLCGCILLAPLRPRHSRRRDTTGSCRYRKARQGALRRHLAMAFRGLAQGVRLSARARCAMPTFSGPAEHNRQNSGGERRSRGGIPGRMRLRVILATGARDTHKPLPRRHTGRLPRCNQLLTQNLKHKLRGG